ncbi:MAG: hypothetical protein VYE77_04320 [Planctomycetota bacterium]|nr:hypothetical protein [Planctomycetota bacterium]
MTTATIIAFTLLGLGGFALALFEWPGRRSGWRNADWTATASSTAALCFVMGSTLYVLAH